MFICGKCDQVVAPRVKPIFVVILEREVEYHTKKADLDGDLRPALVAGREIAKQETHCPTCAGVKVEAPKVPSLPLSAMVMAPELKVSLGSIIFAVMQDKTRFNSKRAAADVNTTYKWMAPFASRGGKL